MVTKYEKRQGTTKGRTINGYLTVGCVGGLAHPDGTRTCIIHGETMTAEDPFGGCDGPVQL